MENKSEIKVAKTDRHLDEIKKEFNGNNKQNSFFQKLELQTSEIEAALPDGYSIERFKRAVKTAWGLSEGLQRCDPRTVISGVMQAAQLGFEINSPLGHAYLIPRANRAHFQLGYQGILELIERTGKFKDIYACEVYKEDKFKYTLGSTVNCYHEPADHRTGDPIKYYACYHTKEGGHFVYVRTKEQILEHAKNTSSTWDKVKKVWRSSDVPWVKHFNAMSLQTVIKGVVKFSPKSNIIKLVDDSVKYELDKNMAEVPNEVSTEVDLDSMSDAEKANGGKEN